MTKQIDELMREVWQMRLAVNPEGQAKRVQAALEAALKPGKPIGYLAHRDGKPSWDEDCVCKDAVYPVDEYDDRVSVAIFTHQARPMKPLTDDQIGLVWSVANGEHSASAAVKRRITRAIEAAHGIKEQS